MSSFSDQSSFDSFDPDESLLVSPNVSRSSRARYARYDAGDNGNGSGGSNNGRHDDHGSEQNDGDSYDNADVNNNAGVNANNNNNGSLETSTSTLTEEAEADESFMNSSTPKKSSSSSFNYQYAMDELDDLAPTPIRTDRKKYRYRPGSSFHNDNAASASPLEERADEDSLFEVDAESPEVKMKSPAKEPALAELTPPQRQRQSDLLSSPPAVQEALAMTAPSSRQQQQQVASSSDVHLKSQELSETLAGPAGSSSSSSPDDVEAETSYSADHAALMALPAGDAVRLAAIAAAAPFGADGSSLAEEASASSLDTAKEPSDNDNNEKNNSSNAASAFRHPCIRLSNFNEPPQLDLKLGYPVNESYDHGDGQQKRSSQRTTTEDNMKTVQDMNLYMEVDVERDVLGNQNESAEFLEADNRIDNVDMDMVGVEIAGGGAGAGDVAGKDKFEEGEVEEAKDSSVGHDNHSAADDSLDVSGDHEHDDDDDTNSADDGAYRHFAASAIKVSRGRRRGPKSRAPVDHSALDITQDVSSLGDDTLDSDDDDDDDDDYEKVLKQKSDYVENMNKSISSYFSSRSDRSTSPVDDSGEKNDLSFQSLNNLDGNLDDEDAGTSFEKDQLLNQAAQGGTSHSKADDDGEMINLSALGSDASQIDVSDTLEYVGYVQNIQYQRFESVLGELNNKQNGIAAMEHNGEEARRGESSDEDIHRERIGEYESNDETQDSVEDVFQELIDEYEVANEHDPVDASAETSFSSETSEKTVVKQPDQTSMPSPDSDERSHPSVSSILQVAAEDAICPNTDDPNVRSLSSECSAGDRQQDHENSASTSPGTLTERNLSFELRRASAEDVGSTVEAPTDDEPATSFSSNHSEEQRPAEEHLLPKSPDAHDNSHPDSSTDKSAHEHKVQAKTFCDAVIETSIVGITSQSSAADVNVGETPPALAHESKSSPLQLSIESRKMESSFENKSTGNGLSDDQNSNISQLSNHQIQVSSPPSEAENVNSRNVNIRRRRSKLSLLKVPVDIGMEQQLLGANLSPIGKSSSPHNSSDLPDDHSNGERFDGANKDKIIGVNQMPAILDTASSPISEKLSPRDCQQSPRDNKAAGILDEIENILSDQGDLCIQEPAFGPSEEEYIDANSSAGSDTAHKGSIFQVLSRPSQECSDNNLDDRMKEIKPQKTSLQGHSPQMCLEQHAQKESFDNENSVSSGEVSFGAAEKTASPPDAISAAEYLCSTPGSAGKNTSLDDLSSYQKDFNSTSSAFLERLRGAAENRKREVRRGRCSMERKEQILYEEKKVRVEAPMPPVEEEIMVKPPIKSVVNHPKKKIEGSNPYRPFKARPFPSTTIEPVRSRTSAVHGKKMQQRNVSKPRENPSVPFKARPMPGTSSSRLKRKSSTAFRPHPAQNKSNVKSSALNTKLPKRLLSGEDASIAKVSGQKKLVQNEEARIRKESTFKARPLPATALTRNQDSLVGEDLLPSKTVRSGKENRNAFVPRSSIRAEERALYDAGKAEREKKQRQDQIERRNQLIDQTRKDIKGLKKFIR